MPLFIDPLDSWLDLLGTTSLLAAYWIYVNLVSKTPSSGKASLNRSIGYFYLAVGIYALSSGLWALATWPLPSSYNLIFSDAWPIFGVALIILGLFNLTYTAEAQGEGEQLRLRGALVGIAALSLIPLIYGVDIWVYGLTNEPALAGLMFFSIGLAGVLSPALTLKSVGKSTAYLLMFLLVVAGIIALLIGVEAIFIHTAAWRTWAPWYGTSK